MNRILIAAALAVLVLAGSSGPAFADGTVTVHIVGVGRVTAPGIDCSRALGAATENGDCDEHVDNGPDFCPDPDTCFPTPGSILLAAEGLGGFSFDRWALACNRAN